MKTMYNMKKKNHMKYHAQFCKSSTLMNLFLNSKIN